MSDASKLERVFNFLEAASSACSRVRRRLFSPDISAADVAPRRLCEEWWYGTTLTVRQQAGAGVERTRLLSPSGALVGAVL